MNKFWFDGFWLNKMLVCSAWPKGSNRVISFFNRNNIHRAIRLLKKIISSMLITSKSFRLANRLTATEPLVALAEHWISDWLVKATPSSFSTLLFRVPLMFGVRCQSQVKMSLVVLHVLLLERRCSVQKTRRVTKLNFGFDHIMVTICKIIATVQWNWNKKIQTAVTSIHPVVSVSTNFLSFHSTD